MSLRGQKLRPCHSGDIVQRSELGEGELASDEQGRLRQHGPASDRGGGSQSLRPTGRRCSAAAAELAGRQHPCCASLPFACRLRHGTVGRSPGVTVQGSRSPAGDAREASANPAEHSRTNATRRSTTGYDEVHVIAIWHP